jgi:GTP-binding protein LepA
VRAQIEDVIGIDASEAVLCSAKSGIGIEDVLEAVVTKLPAPKGDETAPLKALLVDAWYDAYLGVVVLVRVFDGRLRSGQRIKMINAGATYQVDRVGYFRPGRTEVESLGPGEIGFITAQIKEVAHAAVGDTITDERKPTASALPGSRRCSPSSSAASSPWTRPSSRTCAPPSAACA